VFFFPGSVITLAGGALFGPVWGSLYNLVGATIGAVISFLAARYVASDWVENKTHGRIKQLKHGVEDEGWRFVAFVRLVPLFPFNLLNYALGLTKISVREYTLASFVFMLPGSIAYTYLGYVGREAVAGSEGLVQKIMLALALLAIAGFLPSLIKRFRAGATISVDELKTLLEHAQDDPAKELLLLDVRDEKERNAEQGYIKVARHIPLEVLKQRLNEITAYQEKRVAIICRTDKRSAKAAKILAANNFIDVHVVKNGMTAWNKKNYEND